MSCNCGLNEVFTQRVSKHDARKYMRRGLDVRARRMLQALDAEVGLKDRSTLEIGVGAGAFTVEMLKRGAREATGVDAVTNQLEQARQLARYSGVANRLRLERGDFTEIGSRIEAADIVVLDRVVCCYPDWRALLEQAAAHARGALLMSYPRQAWYTRVWVRATNIGFSLLRQTFRLHLHPPADMQALLRSRGFTPRVIGHRAVWELLLATR